MNPENDAPTPIREAITRFGGKTPYDKPMWRVCIAEHCIAIRGGIFHEWPGGELEAITLGPGGKMIFNKVTPTSVKSGLMEVPRYPAEGWILEKWFPAHMWGPRAWWESIRAEDGTPMMGPYPEQGEYFLIAGPWPTCPQISDIEAAIQVYEHNRAKVPVDLDMAVSQAMRDEEDLQKQRFEALVKELELYRTSEILPVMKSTSLAAQAVRNDIQKRLGLKSHLGV